MAYSFFPNDFNNVPNLQDQVFLMRQKQVAQRLLEKADSDKILYTTGGNIAIPDGLNMTPQERKLMAVHAAGSQSVEQDEVLDNPLTPPKTGLPSSQTSTSRQLARDSSGKVGLYNTSMVDQKTGKPRRSLFGVGPEQGSIESIPGTTENMPHTGFGPNNSNKIGKMAVQAGDIAGPFRDEDYTRYGQNLVDQEINDTVQREEDAEGGSYAERRARGRNTRTNFDTRGDADWSPFTNMRPMAVINNNTAKNIIKSVSK
jgi:hypothetical protein